MAEKKQISFIPAWAQDSIVKQAAFANSQLSRLREFVLSHGETFANVLEYSARGADYKVRERKAECVAWLDKTNAPTYVRQQAIDSAVADLGADNLEYWRGLSPMLRVNLTNTTTSACINLAEDVEVSEDSWRVKDSWTESKLGSCRITLSDEAVGDMEDFVQICRLAAKLDSHGYDMAQLLPSATMDITEVGNINPEVFIAQYDCKHDCRYSESEKIE